MGEEVAVLAGACRDEVAIDNDVLIDKLRAIGEGVAVPSGDAIFSRTLVFFDLV